MQFIWNVYLEVALKEGKHENRSVTQTNAYWSKYILKNNINNLNVITYQLISSYRITHKHVHYFDWLI